MAPCLLSNKRLAEPSFPGTALGILWHDSYREQGPPHYPLDPSSALGIEEELPLLRSGCPPAA